MARKKTGTDLTIRPARAGDGHRLAAVLRTEDQLELAATHAGMEPSECLERFIEISDVSLFVSYKNQPWLIAGVYRENLFPGAGLVWMLTGNAVSKFPVRFVKIVRFFLQEWLAYYGTLFNYIDSRYTSAWKLARRLGGILENEQTYYSGQLFLKCTFRRNLWGE